MSNHAGLPQQYGIRDAGERMRRQTAGLEGVRLFMMIITPTKEMWRLANLIRKKNEYYKNNRK